MSHKAEGYASDLTDEQWAMIDPLLPKECWGRPIKIDMRRVYQLMTCTTEVHCRRSQQMLKVEKVAGEALDTIEQIC